MSDTADQASTADLDLLPPVLRIVAVASGLHAALRFAEGKGGIWIYVPNVATPDHPLVELIELPGLKALVDVYARDHVRVPRAVKFLRAMRDRRILAATGSKSVAELAFEHRLTDRWVQKIRAAAAAERLDAACGQVGDEQPGLFE